MSSLLSFVKAAESLKMIRRMGWVEAGIQRPESVADHSFACAVLAMILGDLKGLNADRMIRMALLHDLHESLTGDITPRQRRDTERRKKLLEDKAQERILSELPTPLKRKYGRLISDYRNQNSREAKLMRELDKLEMALQALQYQRSHSATKLSRLLRPATITVKDRDLRHLLSTAKRSTYIK